MFGKVTQRVKDTISDSQINNYKVETKTCKEIKYLIYHNITLFIWMISFLLSHLATYDNLLAYNLKTRKMSTDICRLFRKQKIEIKVKGVKIL